MGANRARCLGRAAAFCLLIGTLLGAEPARTPLVLRDPLQDKNFYLLSSIESTPEIRDLVKGDPALARIGTGKRAALRRAQDSCAADAACYAQAMRWSDDEVAQASAALAALGINPAMSRFVDGALRESGVFQRYSSDTAAALLKNAWQDAAGKMNRVIDQLALPPHIPAGAPPGLTAYDVKSPSFARMMQILTAVVASEPESLELFFEPSLRFTMELLRLHGRDEAARHEPLETGENRSALARIRTMDWARYPYTVILTLGSGPELADVALSPIGRLRLQLAAREFREKKAPFILVSGGYAHPNRTPYNEALEMKKALRNDFGVPEDAIIVEPQANRTTTNLRNAVRLMYRYGVPFDRKGLILTDQLHSATIEAPAFRDRCLRDYGYEPVNILSRVSPFDLEFTPRIDSLHVSALDFVDP
jgi:hypothetical protein